MLPLKEDFSALQRRHWGPDVVLTSHHVGALNALFVALHHAFPGTRLALPSFGATFSGYRWWMVEELAQEHVTVGECDAVTVDCRIETTDRVESIAVHATVWVVWDGKEYLFCAIQLKCTRPWCTDKQRLQTGTQRLKPKEATYLQTRKPEYFGHFELTPAKSDTDWPKWTHWLWKDEMIRCGVDAETIAQHEQLHLRVMAEFERALTTKPLEPERESLDWHILPSETNMLDRITRAQRGRKLQAGPTKTEQLERITLLQSLTPPPIVWEGRVLQGSRSVYYAYEFPNLVVAECSTYGNALYWIDKQVVGRKPSDWQQILGQDRHQAVKRGAHVMRHRGNWQVRLKEIVTK